MKGNREIIFVTIILCLLLGCLIYGKINVNSTTKEIENNEAELLMKLIDDLNRLDRYYDQELKNSDLDDDMLLDMSLVLSTSRENSLFDEEYDYNMVNETSNSYFGRDVKRKDFYCEYDDTILYKFDREKDKYIYNNLHLGHDASGCEVINLFIDGTKTKDIYNVTVKKAFLEEDVGTVKKFYNSYRDASVPTDDPKFSIEIADNQNIDSIIDKEIRKNIEKLNAYKYTFEKRGKNYIFVSVKKV